MEGVCEALLLYGAGVADLVEGLLVGFVVVVCVPEVGGGAFAVGFGCPLHVGLGHGFFWLWVCSHWLIMWRRLLVRRVVVGLVVCWR